MRLTDISIRHDANTCRLVGTVEKGRPSASVELMYEYPLDVAPLLSAAADPFVAALLIPCMSEGEPLEIVPAISPRLLASLDAIQTIVSQWWPALRRVEVLAHSVRSTAANLSGVSASFFSGGVDSFYTCLKHVRESGSSRSARLTHLIHMDGVEALLERSADVGPLRETIREVAERYGLKTIFGKTNMRSLFPISWSTYYHGAGLSSIGLSLSAGFSQILIPSTHSFRHLLPWGSHPLLDPLWSTEETEIVHDGCEVTRVEKTARIAQDPFALQHLRVCLRNGAGLGNCGRCKKCIRTMIALEAMGVLPRATTFPRQLPNDFDKFLPVESDNDRAFAEEILEYLAATDPDSELASAITGRIRRSKRRAATRSYLNNSRLGVALPVMRRIHGAAVRLASIVGHIG